MCFLRTQETGHWECKEVWLVESQEQAGLWAVPVMSQRPPSLEQGWTEDHPH